MATDPNIQFVDDELLQAPPQDYSQAPQTEQHQSMPGQPSPVYYQPAPEQLLLQWVADSRVSIRRSREYYSSLAVIVLLISLILFFAGQILLIFVLLSFLFISYVLATVKAEQVRIQVTSYGIRYNGKLYYWYQLGRFWIRKNRGVEEVHVEAPVFMGSELILLGANAQSEDQVTVDDVSEMLSRFLVYEEPLPSQIDNWVQWLEEKFPLEGRSKQPPRAR
jgi:hypothetical protein